MKNLLLDISNWSFDKKKERRIWNWHTARNHFRLLLYCPAFLWIFFFCLINLVQQGKKRLGISDHPLLIASNFVIHSYLSFLPKSTKNLFLQFSTLSSFQVLSADWLLSNSWDSTNQKRFASGRRFAHIIKKSRSFTCLANQNKGISHVTFENQNSTFLQRKPKHSRSVWKPLRSKISQYSRWIRPWKRPPLFRPPIQRPQKRA